jgi:hypothetical protein
MFAWPPLGFLRDIFADVFDTIKQIRDCRRAASRCLTIYGGLRVDAPSELRRSAGEEFRRVGGDLASLHSTSGPLAKWWCESWKRWDIHSAGDMLISVGNGTQFGGFTFANASPTAMLIRECLRLPAQTRSPIERELLAHASAPAPLTGLHP